MLKILVPTDFSSEAENALNFAVKLASTTDAHIEVLNVVEYNVGIASDPVGIAVPTTYETEFAELMKAGAKQKMDYFLEQFDVEMTSTIQNW